MLTFRATARTSIVSETAPQSNPYQTPTRQGGRRRESNPLQPIDAKRLKVDTTLTESRQKSNTSSTLAATTQNPESDTSPTVSGQSPDKVEGRFCGHCVAHPSERRGEKLPEVDLSSAVPEGSGDAGLDGLELVVSHWPQLSQEVKDSVLRIIQTFSDSR